jgi:hypothetical protein
MWHLATCYNENCLLDHYRDFHERAWGFRNANTRAATLKVKADRVIICDGDAARGGGSLGQFAARSDAGPISDEPGGRHRPGHAAGLGGLECQPCRAVEQEGGIGRRPAAGGQEAAAGVVVADDRAGPGVPQEQAHRAGMASVIDDPIRLLDRDDLDPADPGDPAPGQATRYPGQVHRVGVGPGPGGPWPAVEPGRARAPEP